MASVEPVSGEALSEQPSAVDRVYQAYVRIVSQFGFVRVSGIEYRDDGGDIWSVIDADPDDRAARERIYEAELLASDAAPDADVTFRLVNQREYTPETLNQLLPSGSLGSPRRAAAS